MNVLLPMVVTLAVIHFEMSTLNAAALRNAAGAYVNAVDVDPTKKKENKKLSENQYNGANNEQKTKRWKFWTYCQQ